MGLHTDAVAQDGPASERAGRVDGEHSHFLTVRSGLMHQSVDQGTLARAGRAGYTDDGRVA